MRINNFSNAQFSDDFEFTEKSLHYQNCITRNIDNIEKQITNNSRMVSKIQHRQNNVATTTLLFTNIQKIYQKYGATLLFLLWTLGTTFIGILAIFGTTSISILVPLAIAWFIYGIFLLWDKYSKPKDQLIEDNILSPDKPLENLPVLSRRLEIILNLLFVCGWIISLLILQYSDVRPIIYYVCCSVMATILVISIIFSKKEKTNITHIIKILLFSSLSSLSIFKIYYWSGNDTWAHAGYNEVIADIGFLTPAMGKELDYPLQHLLVVITDILPNLDVRTASLIAITVPSVLVSVTIYLIAKRLIGEKFGLVACILMNLSAYVILWRILAQTTSYGVLVTSVLLAVCFAIFLSEDKKLNSRYLILYIILIITLSLSLSLSLSLLVIYLVHLFLCSLFPDAGLEPHCTPNHYLTKNLLFY